MLKKHCRYVKCHIMVLAIFIFLLIPVFVSAQINSSTETLILQLQQQIKSLQERVSKLQAEVSSTKIELEAVKTELKFNKALKLGARGEEVKELQEFLKQFPDIYPQGLVTGYFGPLTEAAVRKFQSKQGIESIGVVGPKTLSKLNELITEGAGKSEVIPPGLLIAPGLQSRLTATTSLDAKLSNGATTTPSVATSTIPSTVSIPPSPEATAGAASSSTLFTATTTPAGTTPATPAISATPATPTSVSGVPTMSATPAISATPAQTAATATTTTPTTTTDNSSPVLKSVSTSPTTSSIIVIWTTDKPSDSRIEYGTTTSYGSSIVPDSVLITNHSFTLENLSPDSLYYIRLKSKDAAGNELIYTISDRTLALTTPPVISSISVEKSGTGVYVVKWTTDKLINYVQVDLGLTTSFGQSTGKVYKGSDTTTYNLISIGTLNSGTYFFQIKVWDNVDNIGVSSVQTFSTSSVSSNSQPDLWWASLSVGSISALVGQTTTINASIGNAGYGPTNSIPDFVVGTTQNASDVSSGAASGITFQNKVNNCPANLEVKSSCQVSFDIIFSTPGSYRLWLKIDPQNLIAEGGYDNNNSVSITAQITGSASFLDMRAKKLSAISQMLNSLNEIVKQLSQILK